MSEQTATAGNPSLSLEERASELGFVHVTDVRMRISSGVAMLPRETEQDQCGRFNYTTIVGRVGFNDADGRRWIRFGPMTEEIRSFLEACCPRGGGAHIHGINGEEFNAQELVARGRNPFCDLASLRRPAQ